MWAFYAAPQCQTWIKLAVMFAVEETEPRPINALARTAVPMQLLFIVLLSVIDNGELSPDAATAARICPGLL